jgi:hypothetical protein
LKLTCTKVVSQLRRIKGITAREKYVAENRNLLKHQSFGCLISKGNIVAFATVERDEDQLAREPSVVVLRIADPSSLHKVLTECETRQDLQYVQGNTAVFAYEPILKCLQTMNELPLEEQVLHLTPDASEAVSGVRPSGIMAYIRGKWEKDLQYVIGTTQPVQLDLAQVESLLTGFARPLSLIQGPPGKSNLFHRIV